MVVVAGETGNVPEGPTGPAVGLIVTEVALVVIQFNTEEVPDMTDVGLVVNVTVGLGSVTVTVKDAVLDTPAELVAVRM